MNTSKLFFVASLILLGFLTLFAVPKFTFTIAGNKLSWPGLEFSDLGISTRLGTFNQGKGLYPGLDVELSPELSADPGIDNVEKLNNDLALARARMDAAGLYDVQIYAKSKGTELFAVFHFPAYYQQTQAELLARLVMAPGVIKFTEHDANGDKTASSNTLEGIILQQLVQDYIPGPSAISASDISSIEIETRVNLGGNVLRIKFADTIGTRLRDALDRVKNDTNSTKPIVIDVDGLPRFALVDLGVSNEVIAAPIYDLYTSSELLLVSTYPPIAPSTFLSYGDPVTTVLPNAYAPEGHAFLSWTFICVGALTLVWLSRSYSRRKLLAYALSLSMFIMLSIFILKTTSVALSSGFIVGFMGMHMLGVLLLHAYFTSLDQTQSRRHMRDVAIFIFLASSLVYMSNLVFGEYQNMLGVLSIMSAALVVVMVVFTKAFTEDNIPTFKLKLRR